MILIDGRKIAQGIQEEIKSDLKESKEKLGIAAVSVNENEANELFLKRKRKIAKELGVNFKIFNFEKNTSTHRLKEQIEKIGRLKKYAGIIVQLPFSKNINQQDILDTVPFKKDIDCLTSKMRGKLQGDPLIWPPTVGALKEVVKEINPDFDYKGKIVSIVGAGFLTGMPISLYLQKQQSTVISLNEFSPRILDFIQISDIVVGAAGVPGLIKPEFVKEGAILIDYGAGKGDFESKGLENKNIYLTPVPGGMGPIVVAMLYRNLLELQTL